MEGKGIQTTITAFIILIVGIGIIVAKVMDLIDGEDFGIMIASTLTLGTSVIGFLSKDKNKSHTQDK